MIVELYENNSDYNYVNKKLLKIGELNTVLVNANNVLHPVVPRVKNVDIPPKVNYAYIPEFGRYYFVQVETLNAELKNLVLTVDPLVSFKDQLLRCRAVLSRSEKLYNLNLNDEKIKLYSDQQVVYKNFPKQITSYVPQVVVTMTGVKS